MPAPAGPRRTRLATAMVAMMGLSACAQTHFQVPQTNLDEAAYTAIFPYYAEYCAVSEFRKKKGSGIDLEGGGPGGHSVFYLNGVCRVPEMGYPELALCGDSPAGRTGRGVGISVNDHYRNANWVATEGRDFFYDGDLKPGEGVTRASYARTQERAKAMGILDGILFHRAVFDAKPAGMSERDYMYEVSIPTDYAIGLGRDRYCARVPLDRGRMQTVIRYLNGLNEPYRSGQEVFRWHVLRNNCSYLAHNALAAAGLWPEWPTERPLLIAAFDFPVPKNEFVNVMRRTNDMPIADPDALYADDTARSGLTEQGWIPTQPGSLAEAKPAVEPNELYHTDLRLIFFDEAIFGHYRERFDRIFTEPRYTDLASNLAYFSHLYASILASRPTTEPTGDHSGFYHDYYDTIIHERAKVDAEAVRLSRHAG